MPTLLFAYVLLSVSREISASCHSYTLFAQKIAHEKECPVSLPARNEFIIHSRLVEVLSSPCLENKRLLIIDAIGSGHFLKYVGCWVNVKNVTFSVDATIALGANCGWAATLARLLDKWSYFVTVSIPGITSTSYTQKYVLGSIFAAGIVYMLLG